MNKRKIFIDYDSTIVSSIKRICTMYNLEYKYHPRFKEAKWHLVEKFNFSDQCSLLPKEHITDYFNSKDFFDDELEFMENAEEIITKLSSKFDIYVPSLGYAPNLTYKEEWLKEKLPFVKFIGCDFEEVKDKSHINMSGGILIDDNADILSNTNADLKILYGDLYDWNKKWNGIRKWNWYEVYDFLMN